MGQIVNVNDDADVDLLLKVDLPFPNALELERLLKRSEVILAGNAEIPLFHKCGSRRGEGAW